MNQKQFATAMIAVLRKFQEIDQEMQAPTMLTYLAAVAEPNISQHEAQQKLDMTSSSMSRNAAFWSAWTRHREPGPAMIQSVEDPMERRRKVMKLTPKGERFIASLLQTFNKAGELNGD